MTDEAPPTYKFGFSASTGALYDTHLIRNVSIETLDQLGAISLVKQLDNTTPQPASYTVGDTVPYQFVVTNTDAETVTNVVVSDPLISNVSCPSTTLSPAGGPGSSMVCTGSLVVTSGQAANPSLVNTATVNALSSVGVPLSDESSFTVDLDPPVPGLSLEKSGSLNDANSNGLADVGETIAYSFVLTNTGNVTLTGVGVDDPKAGAVTCPTTTLAPGENVTCTADSPYTVTEGDVLAGGVVNTATGRATPPTGVDPIVPPEDTVTTPTVSAVGGLSLEKSGSLNDANSNGLADVGETIAYSFVLTNTGNVTLTGVGVDDPKAGAVTCPTTTLAPGENVTCTADSPYTVTEGDVLAGGVVNTATGRATPPTGVDPIVPPEDTVTTPTVSAVGGLSLEKSGSLNDANSNGLADVGETIAYSFVLTNTGNVTLTGVGVDDPKAGAVTCPTTTLAPGENVTCTADSPYTVTEGDVLAGGVFNTATGNGTTPAGVEPIVPPIDTIVTPASVPGPSLALQKVGSLGDTNGNGLADAGETVVYSFLMVNNGNVTLTGVGVDDPKAGAVTCPTTTLAPGENVTCTADSPYTVTEGDIIAGGVVNTATGNATTPQGVDPIVPPEDTVTTPTPAVASGLSISKAATLNDTNGNGVADVGETIAYSFVLTNTGNVTLTGVGVDDPKAGAVTCPTTTLAPGENVTCTADSPYTVTEGDVLAGGVVNTATGRATPPTGVDPIVPPEDTVTTPTVSAVGGLSLEKSGSLNDANSNGLADVGETIAYSFVLTNTGNVTLTGVGVDDPKAGAVTCPTTTLAPGENVTCTADSPYTVTEGDVLAGGVVNTATGRAKTPEGVEPIVSPSDTVTTATAPASTKVPPTLPEKPVSGTQTAGTLSLTGSNMIGVGAVGILSLVLGTLMVIRVVQRKHSSRA
ncbi:hypothetical protein G7066_02350 [Leucobacter coleopterorum]|uniref:DUF7507 domain-containing protein n=2 Tax=Leucobacter coleopterorum TaxID=2714933 RepID=A0ABX6JYF4_9MICO|nr:hypothetical protein G7066_02350 [Leucobacter coleopterorum]